MNTLPHWAEELIGKPWARKPNPPVTYNCGELVRYIYKTRLGIDSPAIVADPANLRAVLGDVRNLARYGEFAVVEAPREYDVVWMFRRSDPDHIGVYVETADGGMVLHCLRGFGVVLDSPFELRAQGWKALQYMRHSMAGVAACC
ncbi:hypothetical protein [Oleidesulfovibrio alaskensis]|jgi:cell wall-associated NlpC family hydrolase|uniref:hypothetical protein n=1 Tax=Oleidesulfovibrio alaskensis TaxID=58180 RepID=UPI000426BD3D|nr:hypothetical protein [Oleidesulfovibrio alaskensis]